MSIRRVALLTAGGFAPCLSAAVGDLIERYTQVAPEVEIIAYQYGYHGLLTGNYIVIDDEGRKNAGILRDFGGSPIGNSRVKLTNAKNLVERGLVKEGVNPLEFAAEQLRKDGVDVLHTIGGDDTNTTAADLAAYLHENDYELTVVGLPKTIDNDLMHTERTFGFDSAVAIVAEALARLETTARSHGRVMVLETMGRYAGWIALEGGLAGGADVILIPEKPYDLNEVIRVCKEREKKQGYTLICIAEGARPIDGGMVVAKHLENSPDPIRLGGVGNVLRQQLEQHLESEVRTTQLGHVQRGGTPTPYDRVLATRFGWYAAKMVANGEFGRMVVLKGDECASVPIEDVANRTRNVPENHSLLDVATSLGVSLGLPA